MSARGPSLRKQFSSGQYDVYIPGPGERVLIWTGPCGDKPEPWTGSIEATPVPSVLISFQLRKVKSDQYESEKKRIEREAIRDYGAPVNWMTRAMAEASFEANERMAARFIDDAFNDYEQEKT